MRPYTLFRPGALCSFIPSIVQIIVDTEQEQTELEQVSRERQPRGIRNNASLALLFWLYVCINYSLSLSLLLSSSRSSTLLYPLDLFCLYKPRKGFHSPMTGVHARPKRCQHPFFSVGQQEPHDHWITSVIHYNNLLCLMELIVSSTLIRGALYIIYRSNCCMYSFSKRKSIKGQIEIKVKVIRRQWYVLLNIE